MTRRRHFWMMIALAAGLHAADSATGADPRPETLPESTRSAVERQNAITRLLLRAGTDAAPRENLAVAPFSLTAALDLMREAAAGKTAEEFATLLGPSERRRPLRPMDPSQRLTRPRLSALIANNDGYGVKVIGLAKDTPEALAGMRVGDLIFTLDGRPIRSRARLEDAVGRSEAGQSLAFQLFSYESGRLIEPKVILATETISMLGLSSARSVWIQSGARLSDSFRTSARETHGFGLFEVDFRGNPDTARGTIDAWLAREAGRGAIDPSDISPDTRLMFVDSLTLHASWARPFPAATPGEFRTLDGSRVATPMMRQEAIFPFVARERFRMLELPFRDGRRSFVIILTDAPTEALPEATELAATLEALKPVPVDVILPRFTLESSRRVEGDLASLGLKRAFSDEAEFPGLAPDDPWKLGAIRQSVTLEVTETGVKAEALTTAAAVTIRGEQVEPRTFHVDRPFYFLVLDRPAGLILMAGRKVR